MGRNKNIKQKRKFDNDNKQESPVKKAKLADPPPEVPPQPTKPDPEVAKTAEKAKIDRPESTANFLKSKGAFSDEVSSLLSQFKRIYYKTQGQVTSDLTGKVESSLKNCDFSFEWSQTADKTQLHIERFLIAEATTKESACAKLIRLIEDKSALQFVVAKLPFVVRSIPSIKHAKDADLLKILPKLTALKSAADDFKEENVTAPYKVYACAKTAGIQIRQTNAFDKVENCAKCVIALDGFSLFEGTGKTKLIAKGQAFDGLLGEVDALVKKGNKIDASTVDDVPELQNGGGGSGVKKLDLCGAEFVLFEMPGCDAARNLNYSAEMNDNSLVFKVFKGIEAFSLGANFIAAAESDVKEPMTSVAKVAVEKLKRRCYTVVLKKPFPDINIKRNEMLTESELDLLRVEKTLKDFSISYKMQSLLFSSDFSESEQESICNAAKALNLDVNTAPVLTVKKKKMAIESFLGYLIDNGNSADGYELISPENHIL